VSRKVSSSSLKRLNNTDQCFLTNPPIVEFSVICLPILGPHGHKEEQVANTKCFEEAENRTVIPETIEKTIWIVNSIFLPYQYEFLKTFSVELEQQSVW